MSVEVVAALIMDGDRFLICQRAAAKARGLLWEFPGGKLEPGETAAQAVVRECQEELAVTLRPGPTVASLDYRYPDVTIHLTLMACTIAAGRPTCLEHAAIRWITAADLKGYDFCPADSLMAGQVARYVAS